MNNNRSLVVLLPITVLASWITGSCAIAQPDDSGHDPQTLEESHQVAWQYSLDEALKTAAIRRAPVLLIFGAEWCVPCQLLDEEIQQAGIQAELERWVPVHIDVDADQATAGRYAITSIPALRILSPDGRQLAAQEGLISADELTAWLQQHHLVRTGEDAPAGSPEKLNSATVHRVLRDFSSRDATVRESAISRVLTVPQYAAANVVSEFADASLAERLAYLEVLTVWKAPVDGLDPWIPETVTSERISALEEWVTRKEFPDRDLESPMTAAEVIEARRLLRLLVSADPAQATALREQLSRMGLKVLPLIRELMVRELNDDHRARLAAARYRVAASDQIVNDWPNGIERLASTDHQQRISAMQELSDRATQSDEHLVGELVADRVPLIREIALHVLAKIDGGRANGPLLKMLEDPDPNVRAAVLRTLSDTDSETGLAIATSRIVPAIAEYIGREQDIDLIVHAVRCLRGVNTAQSAAAMLPLLDHASWRIRAEAVEGLGAFIVKEGEQGSSISSERSSNLRRICTAVMARLNDEDGFVVSKVIAAFSDGYHAPPVNIADLRNALDSAVNRHPQLARNVVRFAVAKTWVGAEYHENLQQFCHHDVTEIRAAAIAGLVALRKEAAFPDVQTSLTDVEDVVRTSALNALARVIHEQVRNGLKEALDNPETDSDLGTDTASTDKEQTTGDAEEVVDAPAQVSGLTGMAAVIGELFFLGSDTQQLPGGSTRQHSAVQHSAESRDMAYDRVVAKRTLPNTLYEFEPALTNRFENGEDTERLAAARCLSMLGDAEAVAYVLEMTSHSNEVAATKELLTAWPWELRRTLFHRLQNLAETAHDRVEVASAMADDQDPRAAQEIWNLLADEQLAVSDAVAMMQPLWNSYSNHGIYDVSSIDSGVIRIVNDDSRRMILEGTHLQPLLGLLIQNTTNSPELSELADMIVSDSSRPVELRSAALQFQLITQPGNVAKQSAVNMLASGEPRLASIGLKYLSLGTSEITTGPGGFHLRPQHVTYTVHSSQMPSPVVLSPPEGLTVENLQPFLESVNAEDAVYASHLMALLNHFDEVPRLMNHWRSNPHDDAAQKLLYQAIAVSNDPTYISVLEEQYAAMSRSKRSVNMSDFYWTIRSMTGSEILALRKRIRDEQGANQLQQR